MTARSSDAQLARELYARRPDAFERLYADYHVAIYNFCARILGDREEAKDLTQDVFLTAFRDPPAPAGKPVNLRAWLYRVATNACLNHLRRRRAPEGCDGVPLEDVPERVDAFAQAQTVALVEECLGRLNDRYRTALVLKDLHGLPPAEIAAVMGVSRPAADVLVHRARTSFKTAFGRLAGDGGAAPVSLGAVLAPLAVPAALQFAPPLPHLGPAVPPDLTPALHTPPGGARLGKLATLASSKVAVGAAVATLIAAGGTAELVQRAHHRSATAAAAASTRTVAATAAGSICQPRGYWHTRWGGGEWCDHKQWHELRSWYRHKSHGDV